MNDKQIPARTSSTPPNLDEPKHDQARHDSLRAVPTLPIPSATKEQPPKKDAGSVDQANTIEALPIPKAKTDTSSHVFAEPSNLEHSRDAYNAISSAPASVQVTVKPAADKEKSADSSLSVNSAAAEKGPSPKFLRSPGEVSSIYPLRDSESSSRSSSQQSNPGPEPTPTLLPTAIKQSAAVPASFSGPLTPGRDLRLDIGFAGNAVGFRPAQGGNYGVLRNPGVQTPGQYGGGILSGPMHSMGSQGSMQRNSPDSDRWQRAPAFQKGLIPSPQTPLQVMHRAERKYQVGKVNDEEEAKQKRLNAILNKLTPQNFEKLFEQVKAVNIDTVVTLVGVVSQIFDKALMEPTFCEMYAVICYHLAGESPDFSEDNEKITFKRILLNKCQEEFERGEREQEEANRADEEGEVKQPEEEREEKRIQARSRMLGNIRLIGELYKKRMLTERIMHECIKKLLGQYQNPDEEDIEALCILMSTIGEIIDHPKAKEHMDAYFDMMDRLSNNMKLSSRVRFMLRDAIDLRKNKWQQRAGNAVGFKDKPVPT